MLQFYFKMILIAIPPAL